MSNWKAYVSYCSEQQKYDYNLKETDNIQLIDVWADLPNDNINYLNHYYSELVMCYYVWKNQLYSDYVCIWDHRRFITPINFEKLDNNCIQAYYHRYTELTPFEYMIHEGINEYIIWQFIKYMIEEKHIDHDHIMETVFKKPWEDRLWLHSCFNCNWNVFNDLCKFMFDFVNYLIPNGDYTNYESLEQFVKDMKTSICILKSKFNNNEIIDYGRVEGEDRVIGNIYEMLLPLYCEFVGYKSFSEVEDKHIAIKLFSYNKETVVEDIKKIIAKNIFTGCRDFAIITDECNFNELQEIINYNWYYMSNDVIQLFNKDDERLNNYIILDSCEYIDSVSPVNDIDKNNIKKL